MAESPINCEHLGNGECLLASNLIEMPVRASTHACEFCLSCDKPKQLNKAVASIAVSLLLQSNQFDSSNPKHFALQQILTVQMQGPGTELKKLISWFPIPRKTGCNSCRALEAKMNKWGPDKCEQKMPYILRKLRVAAIRRSIPFSETLATTLVRKAIRHARNNHPIQ